MYSAGNRLLFTARTPGSTVSTNLRCGSRWRRRSSIKLSDSSQAPSTLPDLLSTRCSLSANFCSGSNGMEKLTDNVLAPSNCTSDTSTTLSSRPAYRCFNAATSTAAFGATLLAAGAVGAAGLSEESQALSRASAQARNSPLLSMGHS
jgi:hypothetical protein